MKLNNSVLADSRSKNDKISEAVLKVEIFFGKSLLEYQGDENDKFLKITMALPKHVAPAKRLLENTTANENHHYKIFESNVDIETRFNKTISLLI